MQESQVSVPKVVNVQGTVTRHRPKNPDDQVDEGLRIYRMLGITRLGEDPLLGGRFHKFQYDVRNTVPTDIGRQHASRINRLAAANDAVGYVLVTTQIADA